MAARRLDQQAGKKRKMKKMTELTYNHNNCRFLHVVSTGVDGAKGGG